MLIILARQESKDERWDILHMYFNTKNDNKKLLFDIITFNID